MDHHGERRTILDITTLSLRHGHDLRVILNEATVASARLTGADFGAFFYQDRDEQGDRLEVFALAGAHPREFPTSMPMRNTPLFAPTFEGAAPIRIRDVIADPRFGHNASRGLPSPHPPVRSYLAVPVVSISGRVMGALLFSHSEPGRFDADAEKAAVAAATGAGIAIDNALLLAGERSAREIAEVGRAAADANAARIGLLQSLTALLSTSATTADIAERVPRAVTDALGCASAAVYVLDEARGVLVGSRYPPLSGELAAAMDNLLVGADTSVSEAVRQRKPVVYGPVDSRRYLSLPGLDPESPRSCLAVPMFGRDEAVIGALHVHWDDDVEPTGEEVELYASVAAQTALALERAHLLDAERAARDNLARSVSALTELARTLQRGLLPRRLPTLDRVAMAVRYLPAVVGADVGGDWYDAIETGGRVVFVIGDVQGHNTTAAGLMGQLRTAVRAYVTEGHGPAAALQRTNRLLADLGEELFATCCLMQLDQISGDVTVATAGHPVPLVSDARGLWDLTVAPGPPLGIIEDADYPSAQHQLRGRSWVVLYTDGVVESPADQLTEGENSLRRSIRDDQQESCEVLASTILANIPHRLDDDAAMLVLEYAGPSAVREEAMLPLPVDVRAVAQARAFLRTVLRAWQAEPLLDGAELVVSELVTNALVHTDADASLKLSYDGGDRRLTICVRDSSSRHPRGRQADEDALGGRGLGIVEALTEDWGVSLDGEGKTVWAQLLDCSV